MQPYEPAQEEDTPAIRTMQPPGPVGGRRAPVRGSNMLDDIANDMAGWIDQMATEVALAIAPSRSPFSAKITEQQKLEFYKMRLFNPDGSPNVAGRNEEIARLGAEGFGQVYQAVLAAFPELKPPPEPEIEVPEQWPGAGAPVPPGSPGPPPGLPMMPPPMPMPMPMGGP